MQFPSMLIPKYLNDLVEPYTIAFKFYWIIFLLLCLKATNPLAFK